MATIDQLKWSYLTPVVNEIKSPNTHFGNRVFGTRQTLPTETIEISVLNKGREMAPFVKKNGEAVIVTGHTATYQTVEAPNIRIKEPFTPSELLFNRRPGTTIFQQSAGGINRAIDQHIRRDLQGMVDSIENTTEWLASKAIQGTVEYETDGGDVFTITFPKPGAHNITLSTFWDDATPADVDIYTNFMTVKRLMSDYGLTPQDCYLGQEASGAFLTLLVTRASDLDKLWVDAGRLDLNGQFNADGVIFLGRFMGVNMWEYSRSVTEPDGTSTSMVRSKYAEFLPSRTSGQWVTYYGAIPDMDALEGRSMETERFSKSWKEKDPSVMIALVHSRPLCVPRRPFNVSMKVVSG